MDSIRQLRHVIQNAAVPGTAFINLIRNRTFSNIIDSEEDIFCDSMLEQFPDINTTGAAFYTFWYHQSLRIYRTMEKIWLQLDGVNYNGKVFLNGELIKVLDDGMFHDLSLDCSTWWDDHGTNNLAIIVFPPPYLGKATNSCVPKNCGQGGDHEMAKNGAIMQMTLGWDWVQATPDRNTGIWDTIALIESGPARVQSPYVKILHIDFGQNTADINVMFQISTSLSFQRQQVWLHSTVEMTGLGKKKQIISKCHYDLLPNVGYAVNCLANVKNVSFWWPHDQGEAFLYTIVLKVYANMRLSDTVLFKHGFRQVELYYHPIARGPGFRVNNRDLFIHGSNWITTDQFLRFAVDRKRYEREIRLHRDMGFNMIRVWGGGIAERTTFYEYCDTMGILVWQEFWQTADNNGRWGGDYTWPMDHKSYMINVNSTIRRLRSHPSLALWVLGNELYPTNTSPSADLQSLLQESLDALNPDTPYRISSMTTENEYDWTMSMSPADGPYNFRDLFDFSARNPGMNNTWPMAFNPEIGSVSFPTFESLSRFLSNTSWIDEKSWNYHKFLPFRTSRNVTLEKLFDIRGRSIISCKEYAQFAQLAQYMQYQALFESYFAHVFEWYTGVLFWKGHSPWPALRGGLYDYYLFPNGGFYGVQAALQPNHKVLVFMDYSEQRHLLLWNRGRATTSGWNVTVRAFDILTGMRIMQEYFSIERTHDQVLYRVSSIHWPKDTPDVMLFRVEATSNGLIQSKNEYLRARNPQNQVFTGLSELHHAEIRLHSVIYLSSTSIEFWLSSNSTAIGIEIVLLRRVPKKSPRSLKRGCVSEHDDTRVPGSIWDRSYFTMLSNEEHRVTVKFPANGPLPKAVSISSINSERAVFELDVPILETRDM